MSHAWLRDYGSPYFEYGIGLVHAGYQVKITQKIPQLQGGEIYQPGPLDLGHFMRATIFSNQDAKRDFACKLPIPLYRPV